MILSLYVEDILILIFGTSLHVNKEVKEFLFINFKIKDLGEVDIILNIKALSEGNSEYTITLCEKDFDSLWI
jgi:hypothetical protein